MDTFYKRPFSFTDPELILTLSEKTEKTRQLITVEACGSNAVLMMHQKRKTGWQLLLCTDSVIGRDGTGKEKEGDWKTPLGFYTFTHAFGILPDPGCTALSYIQTDDSMYWMSDPDSPSDYNTLITLRTAPEHGSLALSEHLAACGSSYHYVLATNYNAERIPYAGSGIFLHCFNPGKRPTAGCISVSEKSMISLLQNLQRDCLLYITENNSLSKYRT